MISKKTAVALVVAVATLSACSTEQVVDNTVDAGLFATRTVVKTGVGAGKLVVKGGSAAVRSVTSDD
ncbi:hypothetical protein JANAI62_15740 [Jannaschia pagri]|uniref:Uncharacterized protein n=1 Tax=Jannaschia pagri TaxID=2829797 RepID=A0ABQ4NKT0_9RHOB|nr:MULTISPECIES: hypothetical protein [unclassified Jannaschia]GIT91119.1 hypothetical protein JANAI61_15770 [Jannaschia sp. AI_61]GIT94951.1 hypothetical protein JANAI62_15740 [Jannaschia sp. AI_62]